MNIDLLFSDNEFLEFIEKNKSEIENNENGVGKYNNTQNEIILKETNLRIDDIIVYYGQDESRINFIKKYFPKIIEIEKLKQQLLSYLAKNHPNIGKKRWIEVDRVKSIVIKHKILAKILLIK
ncbi:hypothetical protein [Empedobacter tilapiae]